MEVTYFEQQMAQALFSEHAQQQAMHLLTMNAAGSATSTIASTGHRMDRAVTRNNRLQINDQIRLFSAG